MKKRIVVAILLGLMCVVAVYRQQHFVNASTAASGVNESTGNLQGREAVDYLKKEGLFEKVRAAIEADRRELRRVKEEGLKSAGTVWEARHQGQNLRAMFTREGVRLTPGENCAGEGWQAAVSLKGVGYGEKLKRAVAGPTHMEASGKGDEITLVVEDAGAVYPVTIDPLFTEVKKLIASDGAAGDRFGFSVSISGDTVVVGAPLVDSFRGAAYIYERNKGAMGPEADNWGEVKKLTASDGAANDRFGNSVGISGDTVVVGAIGDDFGSGAAYIYERNKGVMGPEADNWGEVKKLMGSGEASFDRFGHSVSISGDTVVVGAYFDDSLRGAAYIYERNKGGADNWGEVKKLSASDGAASEFFGWSVSISADTVVVGAYGDDSVKGSAHIYERNKGGTDNWGEVKKLTASDGEVGDQFGYSVSISVDTVLVGAIGDDSVRGAAYIYERNKGGADNWGEVKKLTASDGAANDQFGHSVSISGDMVVVGAPIDDSFRGAAYIYERNKGAMGPEADNWGEVKKLTASDGASGDRFGYSVGISGDTVVVGAYGDDSFRGSAYIFACEDVAPNTPPTITPMNATRTAGAAASVSTIATVSDAEDAENTLTVTAMLQSGMGVTITGINVNAAGNVTASIAAGCTATTSTFELKVTDSGDLMA
ncbi:MAG: FG-GAP repeat protein, partial [Acidobacteria bacterium]|nr:FG-GAP repeat protein [Acidobacteriota bacterium]